MRIVKIFLLLSFSAFNPPAQLFIGSDANSLVTKAGELISKAFFTSRFLAVIVYSTTNIASMEHSKSHGENYLL